MAEIPAWAWLLAGVGAVLAWSVARITYHLDRLVDRLDKLTSIETRQVDKLDQIATFLRWVAQGVNPTVK